MEEIIIEIMASILTLYLAYIIGIKHRIDFVHRYHYVNIQQNDIIPFCKLIGMGTAIIGFGLIIGSITNIFSTYRFGDYILLFCVIIGLIIHLFCIIKYNGSIFGLIKRK